MAKQVQTRMMAEATEARNKVRRALDCMGEIVRELEEVAEDTFDDLAVEDIIKPLKAIMYQDEGDMTGDSLGAWIDRLQAIADGDYTE